MKHKKIRIAILGSTGSIGTQALEIIQEHHELFEVVLLSAHQNWELLNEQAKTFRARYAVLTGLGHTHTNLQLGDPTITKTYVDPLALNELVCLPEIDVVLNSLVGFAGFHRPFTR
jgi:1-deoxy-D-xylulose-5-phosphate reductoisomerase